MTVLDDDYAAVVMRRQGRIVLPQDVPNPVDNFKVAYGGFSCRCARMVLVIRQWVSCDQFEAAVGIVSSGLSPVEYGFDFFRLCCARLWGSIHLPTRSFARVSDLRIEAVARIEPLVVAYESQLSVIEMAHIVLRRILCAGLSSRFHMACSIAIVSMPFLTM